jgi:transposase-like protein
MGVFDTVWVPCPRCGARYPAQSKGCYNSYEDYELADAPDDVLSDVNRHAPFTCEKCGTTFEVKVVTTAQVVVVP